MEQKRTIIECRQVDKTFVTPKGDVPVVRDFHMQAGENELVALFGPGQCGKTTIINMIAGLEHVTKGEVYVNGTLVDKPGPERGVVFQNINLFPWLTTMGNVEYGLKMAGVPKAERRARAQKYIDLVGLQGFENSYPNQLSGGMSQRVMIAMAMSCNPQLLIADEPTTALDVTIQAQIMDLMRELKEKMNTAIILVTHDLGVVANFADRIQVMYAGQVVERGTAREIFYDSKHPYTWALLSSVPKLAKESKQELYALKGTPPDLILPLNHCPFASRCEYCMPICKEKNPLETTITDTHRVSCWLQHPNAPKVKSFYDREAK